MVEETTEDSFKDIDLAFFSESGTVTKKYQQVARDLGAIVIDNTSAFRMDADVPLVIPEVNPEQLHAHNQLIANPNCSTIQMVVTLKPIGRSIWFATGDCIHLSSGEWSWIGCLKRNGNTNASGSQRKKTSGTYPAIKLR